MLMSKHARTKLACQRHMPEKQALQINKEPIREQQEEHPTLSELDTEIECPRCNEIMELHSKFDELVYFCDNCSFLLKCV
jgi:hypothetical protein